MNAAGEKEVVSGVRWSAAGQAAGQAVSLAVSVVLARLLAPEDFGLLAMAQVFLAFLVIFEDLGTTSAVIQRPDLSPGLLRSLFTVNVAIGLLFAGGLALAAPVFGAIYGTDRVVPVVRALGIAFVFTSLGRVQSALLRRDLRFAALVRIELAVAAAKGALAIGLAAAGLGVWALVAATVFGQALLTALLWAVSRTVLRPGFSWREVRAVAGYSLNLVGFKIANYFSRNADSFLIGRFLGASPLGLYDLAYRLYVYPIGAVTDTLSRVLFPAFSRAQDDDARLRRLFLRATGGIAFLTFPMMTGLFVLASPFVLAVLGERWAATIPLVLVLAPIGLIQSIAVPTGSIYLAKGRSDRLFGWGVASSAVITMSFFAGIRYGVVGVAGAYAIVMVPLTWLAFRFSFPLIGLRMGALLRELAPAAGASAAMGLGVWLARLALEGAGCGPLAVLLACAPIGAALYAGLVLLLRPPALADLLTVAGVRRGAAVTAGA